MEVTGRIIKILEEKTGEGRNGPWRKNQFVLETEGEYSKTICIDVWNDKFDSMPIEVGEQVTAHINIESREWKGNWYTDIKAWKVEKGSASNNQAASQSTPSSTPPFDTSDVPAGKEPDWADDEYDDELPF